jgi:sterol desaturase/sphingolipid hydroxylase (fatty acid hydroxylase superfamily)
MRISMTAFLLRSRPFLVFVPWLAAVYSWMALGGFVNWPAAVLLVVGGLFAWTLVEWVFHRAMHVQVGWPALARFQDLAHMRHHREPHDVEHSVVRLTGSIPLALFFLGASLLVFRELPAALLFHSGLLLGYLAYEFIHLATHAKWRIPGTAYLTRYHHRHHVEGWGRTFGVTSPLWDWIFGTLPGRSRKTRQKT